MSRKTFLRCIIVLALVLAACSSVYAAPLDLTGVWRTNNNSTYYIRQIDQEIWWVGTAPDGAWMNTARGEISHKTKSGNLKEILQAMAESAYGKNLEINLEWVDVPMGKFLNKGEITLNILSANDLVLAEQSGNFGDIHWWRVE